ncbi:putative thiazole-containing bacteriocin maturation protein [Paenibacillus sp. GCM10027626]|uniref:putative thiazole-containing bacteriocin maturation protein n=1 Tax=Paenibacillus sp. GCM10027626 TaxID=3273411 RepID=UPI00362CF9D0
MNPSARLKVKGDTFFLPDENGGVYFRNNTGSFRMDGDSIDQWIEKLLPMLNGEYTMGELTDGLPPLYRERVETIAGVLLNNGFVQDTSLDRAHELSAETLRKYAGQIEFLDSTGGSGAARFQSYRQAKLLAVGSGPIFVSLVAALLTSGMPRFRMLITDPAKTDRQRIADLAAHARLTDSTVELEEAQWPADRSLSTSSNWQEAIRPFSTVLYVSHEEELSALRALHEACRAEQKALIPALCLRQAAMAGPVVRPDSPGCWESAWRRIHRDLLGDEQKAEAASPASSTVEAMLANIIVFEGMKLESGIMGTEPNHSFYLMDAETLEGAWHPFHPHPLVSKLPAIKALPAFELPAAGGRTADSPDKLLAYFSGLTSRATGIFHRWDEGDTRQLPLSQCRVQAVDPLTAEPAPLLPELICAGLTHHEVRREAGMAGIESYASRLAVWLAEEGLLPRMPTGWGIGAGETVEEGICRGLLHSLSEEFERRAKSERPSIYPVQVYKAEDEHSDYYLRSLATMQGPPMIGRGADIAGFPTVWVGTNGSWYGGIGWNCTAALNMALRQALQQAQNGVSSTGRHMVQLPAAGVKIEEVPAQVLTIGAYDAREHGMALQSALQVIKRERMRLQVYDISVEPFLKEELAGVFAVSLGEEASS